jgi:hypothetical protein
MDRGAAGQPFESGHIGEHVPVQNLIQDLIMVGAAAAQFLITGEPEKDE